MSNPIEHTIAPHYRVNASPNAVRTLFMRLMMSGFVTAFLLCSYASAQKIDYDFVRGTDFSKYKTYKWQRADKAKYPGEGIDKMLMRSIDAELAKKGLTKVESEPCDVYVIYQIAVVQDIEWSSFRPAGGWEGVGTTGTPGLQLATPGSTSVIRVGSLIIDIYDIAQKKQVWQAHATKTLKPTGDPKKNERNTQKVMAKIMENYPPRAN